MPAAPPPQHDPDTLRALRRLDRIAEAGMDLLEDLSREAKTGDLDLLARVHAYDRLSRALRLTILLDLRLKKDGLAAVRTPDAQRRTPAEDSDAEPPESLTDFDPPERLDRERPEFDRGDGFERMTLDQALTTIQHGLGLAAPIDLTAENDDEIVPDVSRVLARACGPRPRPTRLSAAFDAQVRALKPKRPP